MTAVPGLVVASTGSGRGKTSVAVGLMAALSRRGLRVQAFKAGPDFLDPAHHARATGRDSHNLDTWMLSETAVRDVLARYAVHADVAVVEGAMGLYDGFSGRDETGSTAHLAKLLGLPVLLVVDARGMGRSVAALVKGFAAFDPGLCLRGVVFNQVGGEGHREILGEAMASLPEVPVLGMIPRDPGFTLPSRHLGLVDPAEVADADAWITALAGGVESGLDLDRLLDALPRRVLVEPVPKRPPEVRVRLGVARDAAFRFYYEENLRLVRQAGAEIVPFSPLSDPDLPAGLDGLYLGGGYPELHAAGLAANATMRRAVAAFADSGRPVYAECGGFMYLMDSLADASGQRFPMAGVFPFAAAMGPRFAALGYREVHTTAPTLLGPAGTVLRGHEFHYSRRVGEPAGIAAVYALSGRKGPLPGPEGFHLGNVLGSYVHLHFGSNPDAAGAFAWAMAQARVSRG
ncbi:cobyrinate a,c-diamide synthase [Desulfolutivibrio sulfoxidireducens]|uniref:cobyrinate a,c-diamide synthase n=1 Tax=Desulfolutivibrio sulfoxidireducens TaxID=2773299 RepID=UPI00159D93BC|nr:cobyrinate a,c-diamide synthase [Desulfolutivibrio sulfoxidireducens]QLA14905.1 cobyrinate a,c-diamide synthase [Desulfolutivibrio sulfoxidireducens]QLA21550.1 cobyrinate a,c-diamide synthase [Desulfolutivibrio sulfoxidireducens]